MVRKIRAANVEEVILILSSVQLPQKGGYYGVIHH